MPTEKEFWNLHHNKQVIRWDHPYCNSQGKVLKYRLEMEKEIGRFLTPKEQVHHHYNWDGSVTLILCSDQQHHSLLHIQEEAFRYCGNVNWRKCVYCKEYDDPKNLSIKQQPYHKSCVNEYYALKR